MIRSLFLASFTAILLTPLVARAQTKDHKPGEELEVTIADGMKLKFCWVPPGKATLGWPKEEKHRSIENAEHDFTTNGFWLGKYTVTQEQWQAVMGENPSWHSKIGLG